MTTEDMRSVERRAVDVILDHLDPPSPRLGRIDWCMNVEKIVRALRERHLLVIGTDRRIQNLRRVMATDYNGTSGRDWVAGGLGGQLAKDLLAIIEAPEPYKNVDVGHVQAATDAE